MRHKLLYGQFREGKIPTFEINGERIKRMVLRDPNTHKLYISYKGVHLYRSDFYRVRETR